MANTSEQACARLMDGHENKHPEEKDLDVLDCYTDPMDVENSESSFQVRQVNGDLDDDVQQRQRDGSTKNKRREEKTEGDPDVLKSKLDFSQHMGDMDYAADDKTDVSENPTAEDEPSDPEDIYTIDLVSSDDEESESVSQTSLNSTVNPEVTGDNQQTKSDDTDSEEPSSKKQKRKRHDWIDPANSKCSEISASTDSKSSILNEEDTIVLSSKEMLPADPSTIIIPGMENIENSVCRQQEQFDPDPADIAHILETFIDSAANDKNLPLHSTSAEETFYMESLFASPEYPSASFNVNTEDGQHSIETEPISSCTNSDGSAQPEMVHVQEENVASAREQELSEINSTNGQQIKKRRRMKKEVAVDKDCHPRSLVCISMAGSVSKSKVTAVLPKRGRPKGSTNKKGSDLTEEKLKKAVAKQLRWEKEKNGTANSKSARQRKFMDLFGNSSSASSLEQEPKLTSYSIVSITDTASEANDVQKSRATALAISDPRIVLAPLTADEIREIRRTSQTPKSTAKACQTEISGLTWSVDFDRIDFRSEWCEKLRILLTNGAELQQVNEQLAAQSSSSRSFNGVDIPSRSIVQRCLDVSSAPKPQLVHPVPAYLRCPPSIHGQNGIGVNTTEKRSSPHILGQVVDNVRSSFRIPKIKKQTSTSPQEVTSSTPNLSAEPRPSTSRSVDQLNSASSSSSKSSGGSGALQRTVCNDNVDAANGNASSRDLQEARLRLMMQDTFKAPVDRNMNLGRENALNALCTPPSSAENGPPGVIQPIPNQDLRPATLSMTLENQSGPRNRAELLNIRRTIHNDVLQQQQQPQQQPQTVLSGIRELIAQSFNPKANENVSQMPNAFPVFGNLQPTSFPASSSSAFNRGGHAFDYPGVDCNMMNKQQQQPRGNFESFNDFASMLWEQFKQQQQPPRQHTSIQPPTASLQNIPIPGGLSQLPASKQLFPKIGQVTTIRSLTSQAEPRRCSEQMGSFSIFGCIDFLNNRCITTHCRYPHILPSEEELFQKLSALNNDTIMDSYRFVASREDLFVQYFPVYARVMGRNNMYEQLVGTIADCEQPKRPIQYYVYIVEGLKAIGIHPVNAVQLLLDKHQKKDFNQINVLIKLILDTGEGIPTFLGKLEDFFNVKGYQFEKISVNRLLAFCMLSTLPTNDLARFVCKLMLRVPAGEEQLVDIRVLLEFIQKVGLDPALALDVADIVKKYGSVVMRA